MEYLHSIEFWHWWIAAVVFIILETLLPGTVFLWMGISAGVVGLVLWQISSLNWEWQFLLFTVFAIVTILLWRKHLQKHPTKSTDENLNQRNRLYIGRTFTLLEPIVDGVGRIQVDDSLWRIEGPDCDKGCRVTVTDANNLILKVERVL